MELCIYFGISGLYYLALATYYLKNSESKYSNSGLEAALFLWTLPICWANSISDSWSGLSKRIKIRSNLLNRAAGILRLSWGDLFLLYLPNWGFAAANIEVLAFKVVVIPALAIETVYCSITSWIDVLSNSFILSNSSIQQTPISASTRAPPSNDISLV